MLQRRAVTERWRDYTGPEDARSSKETAREPSGSTPSAPTLTSRRESAGGAEIHQMFVVWAPGPLLPARPGCTFFVGWRHRSSDCARTEHDAKMNPHRCRGSIPRAASLWGDPHMGWTCLWILAVGLKASRIDCSGSWLGILPRTCASSSFTGLCAEGVPAYAQSTK